MSFVMDESEFFPRGLALGDHFCNRVEEQKRLSSNIKSTTATLIVSPRRYGKTSLALTVLHNHKIPYAYIDLYAEMDEDGISNTILGGIGDILYRLESGPKKAIKAVTDFFAGLSISFSFKGAEVKVEFPGARKSPAKLVLTALKGLDALLQKKKKKIVLFLDEFQRLNEVSESVTIEGALRHVAQQSRNICFIFSGSNRHMLNKMFEDRTRPFYNLCDKISLERIAAGDYRPFIQSRAQEKWSKPLAEEIIEEIFFFSMRHPYYLNVLCHQLWNNKEAPTIKTVIAAWEQYAQEEKSKIISDLDNLSSNQSKMLRAIAKYGIKYQATSKEFLALTKFSSSSAVQALKRLQAADYLYVDEKGRYHLLDPLMEYLYSA